MMHRFHCDFISMTELKSPCFSVSKSYMSKPVTLFLEGSSDLVSLVESINS
jgi:hypothetical protein